MTKHTGGSQCRCHLFALQLPVLEILLISLTCSAATSGVFPQTPTSVQDTLFSVCSHW